MYKKEAVVQFLYFIIGVQTKE